MEHREDPHRGRKRQRREDRPERVEDAGVGIGQQRPSPDTASHQTGRRPRLHASCTTFSSGMLYGTMSRPTNVRRVSSGSAYATSTRAVKRIPGRSLWTRALTLTLTFTSAFTIARPGRPAFFAAGPRRRTRRAPGPSARARSLALPPAIRSGGVRPRGAARRMRAAPARPGLLSVHENRAIRPEAAQDEEPRRIGVLRGQAQVLGLFSRTVRRPDAPPRPRGLRSPRRLPPARAPGARAGPPRVRALRASLRAGACPGERPGSVQSRRWSPPNRAKPGSGGWCRPANAESSERPPKGAPEDASAANPERAAETAHRARDPPDRDQVSTVRDARAPASPSTRPVDRTRSGTGRRTERPRAATGSGRPSRPGSERALRIPSGDRPREVVGARTLASWAVLAIRRFAAMGTRVRIATPATSAPRPPGRSARAGEDGQRPQKTRLGERRRQGIPGVQSRAGRGSGPVRRNRADARRELRRDDGGGGDEDGSPQDPGRPPQAGAEAVDREAGENREAQDDGRRELLGVAQRDPGGLLAKALGNESEDDGERRADQEQGRANRAPGPRSFRSATRATTAKAPQ